MKKAVFLIASAAAVFIAGSTSGRAVPTRTLSVPLARPTDIRNQTVAYTCRAKKGVSSAKLLSLFPGKTLTVSYINADDISLAVFPVAVKTRVFANIIAGSGAKYVAAEYTWWTEGEEATLTTALNASAMLVCREVSR